ncbi:hypothetical protein KSS87_011720 [Heliosperma pusillum]|nr:hypothetical protein KSS87_011720 [Heliosperma pusillum]
MAGFFSPNNTSEDQQPPPTKQHNHNNWYLNRSHELSSSYYHYNNNNMDIKEGTSSTYESWPQPIYNSETIGSDGGEEYNRIMMMRRISDTGGTGSGSGSGSGTGTISCQDCGNQAKKDCEHMRCRTCCKSRGFHCATHVKSTWIPASVRRHRHQNPNDGEEQQQQQQQGCGSSQVKRRRDNNIPNIITSSSLIIPSQLPIITTPATTVVATATATTSYAGMELGNFPAEVSSPALFRCVRVSSMNDNEDEVAYQTAVRIGGHVFKGILYDQGPADNPQGGNSSSGGYGSGPLLNLAARPSTSTAAIVGVSSPALGYIDPSLYPAPLSPYMPPGTQFFPNPRP